MNWLSYYCLCLGIVTHITVAIGNLESPDVSEVANTLHVTTGNSSVKEEGGNIMVDLNGYILFCPCMGRFGNQMSQYIGAVAFAKGLNRTLVLPPFIKYPPKSATSERIPFTDYFNLTLIQSYHKAIPMEQFMEELAPTVWPQGRRAGYCYGKDGGCPRMKEGNPPGPFWDHFNVSFDSYYNYVLYYETIHDARNAQRWHKQFPVAKHLVLALSGAPGSFPVVKHNKHLQKHFKWSNNIASLANIFIQEYLTDEPFVGIHLRLGSDWLRACDHLKDSNSGTAHMTNMMESPQCLDYGGKLTYDICYPSHEDILEQTAAVVKQIQAKAIFVASDSDFMIDKLQHKCKTKVVRRLPSDPQVDLAILSQSTHFIGNCVSSFTAIVKRDRDVNNKPSSFWNYM